MEARFFDYDGQSVAVAPDRNKAILKSLDDDEWDKLAAFGAIRRYPAGANIVASGSTDRALYFVLSGSVRITSGNADRMLDEGNVFGLTAFLDSLPSGIEAATATAAELFMLAPQGFQQLAAWHPRLAVLLLTDVGTDLATRLRELRQVA
jgi:CRP-like cAMP-binding protein